MTDFVQIFLSMCGLLQKKTAFFFECLIKHTFIAHVVWRSPAIKNCEIKPYYMVRKRCQICHQIHVNKFVYQNWALFDSRKSRYATTDKKKRLSENTKKCLTIQGDQCLNLFELQTSTKKCKISTTWHNVKKCKWRLLIAKNSINDINKLWNNSVVEKIKKKVFVLKFKTIVSWFKKNRSKKRLNKKKSHCYCLQFAMRRYQQGYKEEMRTGVSVINLVVLQRKSHDSHCHIHC